MTSHTPNMQMNTHGNYEDFNSTENTETLSVVCEIGNGQRTYIRGQIDPLRGDDEYRTEAANQICGGNGTYLPNAFHNVDTVQEPSGHQFR